MANNAQTHILQNAIQYFQAGDVNACEKQLNSFHDINKRVALSWFLLATVHLQKSDIKKSITEYKQAIALQPNYPEAHHNLGVAYEKSDDIVKAEKHYQQAIKQNPKYTSALFNLGNIKQNSGQYESARKFYQRALKIDSQYVKALNNLGLICQHQHEYQEAITYLTQAIKLAPNDSDVHTNLANCYKSIGDDKNALNHYQAALILAPNNAEIHNNLGLLFQELENEAQAINHLQTAIKLRSNYVEALTNIANIFRNQHQLEEAQKLYQLALSHNPNYCEAHNNYGLLLYQYDKYPEAAGQFKQALNADPNFTEAKYNYATNSLASGNFVEGWKYYAARPSRRHSRCMDVSQLTPEMLQDKTVLLLAEQGIGDELFFLRFAPYLRRYCRQLDVQCSNKIKFCITQIPEIDNVFDEEILANIPDYDYYLSIGDLPVLLVSDNNHIPPSVRLNASAQFLQETQTLLDSLGAPPYFAFTWRAGQQVDKFLYKSIPLESVWPVLSGLPGTLINIQRHPTQSERESLAVLSEQSHKPIADLTALNEDLPKMLALLSLVDEYIGVSNSNMHLRKALGKTAHVLLPHPPEWRWMFSQQSPWFADFKVFRQTASGSWDSAIQMLNKDLQRCYG